MKSLYPTYKEFCVWMHSWNKLIGKDSETNWIKKIIYYIFALMALTFLYALSESPSRRRSREYESEYPSDKYRKVVKEGIFWDSIEWHER